MKWAFYAALGLLSLPVAFWAATYAVLLGLTRDKR